MKNGIVWDGLKGEDMTEVYAMVVPTNYKSLVAPPKPKREKAKSVRRKGKVRMFNLQRNFGFVRSGKDDFFFHISTATEPGLTYLMHGERVTFEVGEDRQGRPIAVKVALAS
ncbi:cold-shock protein [Paenibacillus lautus]|uniref:cold-shock protein n=1 Tax=Paenibacillus lautus TaxID=1401 RepID=UPI00385028F2